MTARPLDRRSVGGVSDTAAIRSVQQVHPATMEDPVVGERTASGDGEVVAAPGADLRLVVHFLYTLTDPDSSTTPVVHWKSTDATFDLFKGFAISKTWTWKLPANVGLTLNLSDAAGGSGAVFTVFYSVEAV